MLGFDAWLSLFGPAYFAYAGIAAPFMVVWAIACAALAMWNAGQRRTKRGVAGGEIPVRTWSASVRMFVVVAACYVAAHSVVYLLVGRLIRLWL